MTRKHCKLYNTCPQVTSSTKAASVNQSRVQHGSVSSSFAPDSPSVAAEFFTHPSFSHTREPVVVQRSSKQRDDIPLKVLIINCLSIVDKKPLLENMIESTQADIVLGTESWLKSDHLSTAIFPNGFKVYRKDRTIKAGGAFVLVSEKLISSEPEELKVDGGCEMVWAQIQVPRTSQLFVGSFYRPPNMNDPDYLGQLNTCLSRIPVGAHTHGLGVTLT